MTVFSNEGGMLATPHGFTQDLCGKVGCDKLATVLLTSQNGAYQFKLCEAHASDAEKHLGMKRVGPKVTA